MEYDFNPFTNKVKHIWKILPLSRMKTLHKVAFYVGIRELGGGGRLLSEFLVSVKNMASFEKEGPATIETFR